MVHLADPVLIFKICLKALLQRTAARRTCLREVESERQVAVAVRRRMTADPKPAEEFLEVRLLAPVVVALHHADEERLAEPPRTDEEDEPVTFLEFRKVLGLVDVAKPLVSNGLEIRNAVGYLQIRSLVHARIIISRQFLTYRKRMTASREQTLGTISVSA